MKFLSEAAVRHYAEAGYYAPVRVLSTAEAAALRARLETFEAGAARLAGNLRQKSHLLFTWLNDLMRHERILDAVEDLIGGDILCWGSSFFIKEARDPAMCRGTRTHLLGAGAGGYRHRLGGAVGQHRRERGDAGDPRQPLREQVPHRDTFAPDNLL